MSISIECLNMIFESFNPLSEVVFWINTADYSKQLYISPSYKKVFGAPVERAYNFPGSWAEPIMPTCKQEVIKQLQIRKNNQNKDPSYESAIYYPIPHGSDYTKFVKNNSYPLIDKQQRIIAYFGTGEVVSEDEWHAAYKQQLILPKKSDASQFIHTMCTMLIPDLHNDPDVINRAVRVKDPMTEVMFTKREHECLQLLLQGYSAKQTGAKLNLSSRTVETYLDLIKKKLQCRTKLEAISKLKKIMTVDYSGVKHESS